MQGPAGHHQPDARLTICARARHARTMRRATEPRRHRGEPAGAGERVRRSVAHVFLERAPHARASVSTRGPARLWRDARAARLRGRRVG
jgi:hypothetical protein